MLLAALFVLLIIVLALVVPKPPLPLPPLAHLTKQQRSEMVSCLNESGLPPDKYIISKFRQADVVFLGERHRLRQDPLFVQQLLPVLYKNGITLLGFEFACPEDQDRIDRLLTATTYNEDQALAILRDLDCGIWPYREYLDIFKAAWQVNCNLPPDADKFRILGMTAYVNGNRLKYGTPEERAEQQRRINSTDSLIATIVEKEALQKGKKILVYCGRHHAFSRFHQPMYNDSDQFVGKYFTDRGGNRLLDKYPGRVTTVMLHAPVDYRGFIADGLPFYGLIDQAFAFYGNPVGFDVATPPFSEFTDSSSVYSLGYGKISLTDYCDGYIILNDIMQSTSAALIDTWFAGTSFSEFKRALPQPIPWFIFHPKIFMWLMKSDGEKVNANFAALAAQLKEEESR